MVQEPSGRPVGGSGADPPGVVQTRPGTPAHLQGMETNTTTLSGLEPLLSVEELSEYLNVPVRTLYDRRLSGKGPCAVHVGRQLRYFVSDVHD
ncbi:MAG: helix-turn-helix domain-containing protein [Ornithinimicrobium sp.]